MAPNLIGKIIANRYRVDAFLAAGGMGAVYRVYDLQRNIVLAMKVLDPELADDPAMFKSFQRDGRALQKLAHTNIIPFYGLSKGGEFPYMLMEYIDGPTLKDYLRQKEGKPLSEGEALTFLKAICSALGYAHSMGVVHCDIKPANVMINRGGRIYLGDFGIARHADSGTTTLAGAGAPAYMAPEQILRKSVTPATDIYAMGGILFEMFTGQRPFRATAESTHDTDGLVSERVRQAHLKQPPPDPREINPGINGRLAGVILKALEKEPLQRYQTCQELLDAVCQSVGMVIDQIPDRVEGIKVSGDGIKPPQQPPPPPHPLLKKR